MNPIRILLVQSAVEDAQFLREALDEIQETARPGDWTAYSVTHVETADDARLVAASERSDVILFDPASSAAPPLAAFAGLAGLVLDTPVIILLNRANHMLAARFLREGAQDVLLKEEIDCSPLARAIQHAIHRQRFLSAYRQSECYDPLTGAYNDWGFQTAARRELRMAATAGATVLLLLAAVESFADSSDQALIDAAALLRQTLLPEAAFVAVTAQSRFAVMLWNTQPETVIGRLQSALAQTPRPFAFSFGWAQGRPSDGDSLETMLHDAETCLCENGALFETVSEPLRSMPPTASATASPG